MKDRKKFSRVTPKELASFQEVQDQIQFLMYLGQLFFQIIGFPRAGMFGSSERPGSVRPGKAIRFELVAPG